MRPGKRPPKSVRRYAFRRFPCPEFAWRAQEYRPNDPALQSRPRTKISPSSYRAKNTSRCYSLRGAGRIDAPNRRCFLPIRPARPVRCNDRETPLTLLSPLAWAASSIVKLIEQISIEGCSKHIEVRVPLRPTQNDDVIGVDGADRACDALVKRLKGRVELL